MSYEIMFWLIKIFFILLTSMAGVSNHTKCVSLSNQKCITQLTRINLHPYEYSKKLSNYLFAFNLDKSAESCNTLDDSFNRVFVPNEVEDLTLHVFNMITGINKSRTLAKHIPCKCECKFDNKKCNSSQKWSKNRCQCECKKNIVCATKMHLESWNIKLQKW